MNSIPREDKDKDKNPEVVPPQLPESIMPTEIIAKRDYTNEQIGEVMWPKVPQEQILYLDKGYDDLVKRQDAVLAKLNNGETPSNLINHKKLETAVTKLQIHHAKELEKLSLTKEKAGAVDELQKVSELNQKRLKGYMEAIGEGSKALAKAVGKSGLSLGKSALKLLGAGLKTGAKVGRAIISEIVQLCYDIADIHKKYKANNPKSI